MNDHHDQHHHHYQYHLLYHHHHNHQKLLINYHHEHYHHHQNYGVTANGIITSTKSSPLSPSIIPTTIITTHCHHNHYQYHHQHQTPLLIIGEPCEVLRRSCALSKH
jgi:hypothetical protein